MIWKYGRNKEQFTMKTYRKCGEAVYGMQWHKKEIKKEKHKDK